MTATVTTLSILVADDEEAIRSMLVDWLRRQGHAVATAGNAQEAVQLLRNHHFDLAITDVVMPDGDGFELIAAFRKEQPATRIVAISGGGQYIHGQECLNLACGLGAHAAVLKPFNWEQLQAGIDLALPPPDTCPD